MENHDELYQLFCTQEPDITFTNRTKKYSANKPFDDMVFDEYFAKQYALVEKIKVERFSTDRLFYSVYYNKAQNDVRIERLEYGCFHGSENFVSLEQVNQREKEIQKEIAKHEKNNVDNGYDFDIKLLKQELEAIQKVQALYSELKKVTA